jgi:hypothetical protein
MPADKLTEAQVRRLMTAYNHGVLIEDLADRFGLCPDHLVTIIRRERSPTDKPLRSAARPFSAEDDALVRQHYPLSGTVALRKLLPERTRNSIIGRATRLGLRGPVNCEARVKSRSNSTQFPLDQQPNL